MNFKIVQHWFAIALFCLVFFIVSYQPVSAFNEKQAEVTMDSYGDFEISPIYYQDESFNTVFIDSEEELEELLVNYDPLNGGGWEEAEVHDDGYGASGILFTSPATSVQFKRVNTAKHQTTFKARFYNFESDDEDPDYYAGTELAAKTYRVISRKEWGADENIRYWTPEMEEFFRSNGKQKSYKGVCGDFSTKYANETRLSRTVKYGPGGERLIWPISYAKNIEKIVVHHTDSELRDLTGDKRMDGRDYKAMLRAIYYFHTVSRGWGDIGYNYIIDPLGNIYEGRYGGDRVIGAHAQCYNNGSIGIAIIGNYESQNISQPAMNSLLALVAKKSKTYGFDPDSRSSFRGKVRQNILGHKDLRPTSCPGTRLYSSLSQIRDRASILARSGAFRESSLSAQTLDYNADPLSDVSALSLKPKGVKKISLKFRNIGKKTWDKNTWLHVAQNNRKEARVIPIIENKAFVAANMKEDRVSPGQTATFEVELESGYIAGNQVFEVAPVVNGRYKVSRAAVFIPVETEEPRFDYRVVSKDLPAGNVFQGQKLQGKVVLQNIGNVKWVNYGETPIRMGTEALRDRRSILVNSSRIAHLVESEVLPGESGTFFFDMEVPLRYEGRIKERFTPVIEHVRWLDDRGLGFDVIAKKPRHAARILNKTRVPYLLPGEMRKIDLTLENKGDLPWEQDNMRISLVSRGIQLFKKRLVPTSLVQPKKTTDFSFWIQAPYKAGKHSVFLKPRFKQLPIRGGTSRFLIDVPEPKLRAQLVEQSERSISIRPWEEIEVEVKYKNLSNAVWRSNGPNAIHIAPAKPQDRLSRLYNRDEWVNRHRATTMVEKVVKPGEVGTFRFKVKPKSRGLYREYFQLVIERVGWIDGSFVRWDFKVAGDRKVGSSSTRKVKTVTVAKTTSKTANKTTQNTVRTSVDKEVPAQSERPFSVRISHDKSNATIRVNKKYKIIDSKNKTMFSIGAGTSVDVRKIGSNIHVQLGGTVKSSDIIRVIPDVGGIVEIVSMERRPAWNTKLNDNRFRGVMEIRVVNNETAYINELPLEDYLSGLAEVSNGSHSEKQKTIAILARTYARFYMDDANRKFPGLPYDGSDDPAVFQRYLGYGVEVRSPNFVSAAKSTEDMVVTYNGTLIKTPYFTQSDGRTRSAEEVWGWKNTPYLQSVDDPHCKGLTRKGHGVGLSGCGSDAMAKEGKGYEEIIKYYYQGVEVEKLRF